MRKLIDKLISKIKKNDYMIDNRISTTDLLTISLEKIITLLRGKIIFPNKKNIFIGKKVDLKRKRYISLGSGCTIKDYAEIDALSEYGVKFGNNVSIGKYSIIRGTGSYKVLGKGLKIGNNFGCADFCFFGCTGGIEIGDNVIMGQNVRLHSQNHLFDNINIPIREQGVISKGIKIGNNCWIGSGAVLLDGIKIGDGCVIGANSLVNKDIEDNAIAVGNPAKIIKYRK